MKDRIQVNDLTQALLAPDAKPVDTYFRPQAEAVAQPGDSDLTQLFEGLGKIRPQVLDVAKTYINTQGQKEDAQGTQAYQDAILKDQSVNQTGWKTLVDNGTIPAGASPWFQQGFRKAQLKNMGDQYGRDLTVAWNANGDLKNSDDPAKLNQFIAEQQQGFMDKVKGLDSGFTPTELTEVLDPSVNHYNHAVAAGHVAYRVDAIEKDAVSTLGADVGHMSSLNSIPMEERAANINFSVDQMIKNGLDKQKASRTAIDAVTQSATDSADPELLNKLLPMIKGGTGSVADTQYAKASVEQAQHKIVMKQNEQYRKKEAEDAAELNRLTGEVMIAISKGQTPDQASMQYLARNGGANIYASSIGLMMQMRSLHDYTPPAQAAQVTYQIMSGTYPGATSHTDAVRMAGADGTLRLQNWEPIMRQALELDNAGVDKVPLVAALKHQLEVNGDPTLGGVKIFKDPNAIPRVISDFYQEVNRIRKENPGKAMEDLSDPIRKAYDAVLDGNRKNFPGDFVDGNAKPSTVSQSALQPPKAAEATTPAAVAPVNVQASSKTDLGNGREGSGLSKPSPEDVTYLRVHPEMADQFKAHFGEKEYNSAMGINQPVGSADSVTPEQRKKAVDQSAIKAGKAIVTGINGIADGFVSPFSRAYSNTSPRPDYSKF